MPWYDLISAAGPNQTLARARKALGRKTVYDLGEGGMNPVRDLDRLCDCSGFVAWAIGIPRQLPPSTGGWLDTDAYAAGGGKVFPKLLAPVPDGQAVPGDIYVYPDRYVKKTKVGEGHMGIISAVDGGGAPTHVIHCSWSNYKNKGDAVRETAPTAFLNNAAARVMRLDYAALKAKFAPGHVAPVPKVAKSGAAAAPLQHPLLSGEQVLQAIASGSKGWLRATGGTVPGIGAVQDVLNHIGTKYPEYRVAYGANRGAFGPKTEQAVKNFQASHEIKPDGLVGRDTLEALDAAARSVDANGGVDTTRTDPPTQEHIPAGDFHRIFIQRIAPVARATAQKTGVPASITIAQAALESNWGRSLLALEAKNYFGIKGTGPAGSVKMPTLEWSGGKFVKVKADFRAYNTLEESIDDHARLISTAKWKTGIPIYREAMKHTAEPRKFAAALEGVYATDPDYAEKLWRMMDQYELEEYDVVS